MAARAATKACWTLKKRHPLLCVVCSAGREEADVRFPRDVVFLLDRSSAKTGTGRMRHIAT